MTKYSNRIPPKPVARRRKTEQDAPSWRKEVTAESLREFTSIMTFPLSAEERSAQVASQIRHAMDHSATGLFNQLLSATDPAGRPNVGRDLRMEDISEASRRIMDETMTSMSDIMNRQIAMDAVATYGAMNAANPASEPQLRRQYPGWMEEEFRGNVHVRNAAYAAPEPPGRLVHDARWWFNLRMADGNIPSSQPPYSFNSELNEVFPETPGRHMFMYADGRILMVHREPSPHAGYTTYRVESESVRRVCGAPGNLARVLEVSNMLAGPRLRIDQEIASEFRHWFRREMTRGCGRCLECDRDIPF